MVVSFGLCLAAPTPAQKAVSGSADRAPDCSPKIGNKKARRELPYALNECTPMSSITPDYYREVAGKYKEFRTQALRNRLIFMAVAQIDLNFSGYERNRRHRNNLFQTLINILEVGAATAISITNGERAKTIIADGLGFIQGSRDSINKNYRLLERQILVNKMIEKRSKILTEIYKKTNLSDEQYPFERAYVDILDYFEAGTTDSALNSLATDTGSNANYAREQLLLEKREAGIVLAPSAEQIAVSRENSDFVQAIIDREEEARSKAAAAEKKITEAEAALGVETARQPPDPEQLEAAKRHKLTAEAEKTAALAEQTAALDKLKAIFQSIENDSVLSPLLDDLPALFPNQAPDIKSSLRRMRENKGTADDYAAIILMFYRRVTDAVRNNPTAVERAKNILNSVK